MTIKKVEQVPMTNKEAIQHIKLILLRSRAGKLNIITHGEEIALNLAIKALEEQERPTIRYTYADGYLQGYIDGSTGTDWRMIEE